MNRFIQYSLIAGACLSIFGFGTAVAARVNGGSWEQLNLRNHSMAMGNSHWHSQSEEIELIEQVSPAKETDEQTMRFSASEINELTLDLNGCEFIIAEEEGNEILVSCDSYAQMQDLVQISYDNDGELSIYTIKKDNRTPKITLTIPSGYLFDEADIRLVSGSCAIQTINIQEFNLYLSNGQVTVQNGTVYEAEIECTGGSISYNGLLLGDADIQCSGGSIFLDLQQAKKEFDYEIEGVTGEIIIGTQDFAGVAYEKEIVNHAEWTMELTCSAGKIQVAYLSEE